MLADHLMVNPDEPALKHRPHGFQPVSVNHSANVLLRAVANDLVMAIHADMRRRLVSIDDLTPTTGVLPTAPRPARKFLGFALVLLQIAHVGLVHLQRSPERRLLDVCPRLPDSVGEMPRGFLRDA